MNKHRGGKRRGYKKQSPTAKFIMVNKDHFGNGSNPDYRKIKMVNGYLQLAIK